MEVFQIESTVTLVVFFVLLAVKIFAVGSALLFPSEAYSAAGKLTKPAWCILLGLGVVFQVVGSPIGIISIVFTVAAFVYLADVRPALTSLTRR